MNCGTKVSKHLLHVVFAFLFVQISNTYAQQSRMRPVVNPSDCKNDEYFDTARFSCVKCPTANRISTIGSRDKLSCQCPKGSKKLSDYGGASIMCERCPEKQMATPDGWACIPCGGANLIPDTNFPETCGRCASNQLALIVRNRLGKINANVDCQPCQQGTRPDQLNGQHCVACNPGQHGRHCSCSNENMIGGVCFDKKTMAELPPSASPNLYKVAYELSVGPDDKEQERTIQSAFFVEHARAAIGMCGKTRKNATACQLLGNLCALTHYRKDDGTVCKHLIELARQSASGHNQESPPNMPWLYYLGGINALKETDINTPFVFENGAANSILRLVAVKYSARGDYLGRENVTGGTLQLCERPKTVLDGAFQFGQENHQSCETSAKQLLKHAAANLFYELWLEVKDAEKTSLYPIPVVDMNFKKNNQFVNRKEAPSELFSFTLYGNLTIEILRFAQTLSIEIELRKTNDGRIFPPVLKVKYGAVTAAQIKGNVNVHLYFNVKYWKLADRHERTVEIAMTILTALALVWAMFKTFSWKRRAGKPVIDASVFVKGALYFINNMGNVFLIFTMIFSLWYTLGYKLQRVIFFVILTEQQEFALTMFIVAAFLCKTVDASVNVMDLSLTETFFIDWEKPRGHVIPSTVSGVEEQLEPSSSAAPVHDLSAPVDENTPTERPITIWRTYLVANEWNELQNYRKTSNAVQMIVLIVLLELFNFKALAIIQPGFSGVSWESQAEEYHSSKMTRFALASGLYLLLAMVQWTVNVMVLEPCFAMHFLNFMDLCSLCNISVLALTRAQYGHYIHGRSVHGHADTDMKEMNDMLQREKENLCGQRGLEAGAECQCFRVALPQSFRHNYENIKEPLKRQSRRQHEAVLAVSAVYGRMNAFLTAFIDQRLNDLAYVIKDMAALEALLDMDLAMEENTSTAVFYRDESNTAYSAAFLYGNEWIHLSFEMSLFCLIDLLFGNFILAAAATFLASGAFKGLTEFVTRRNLAVTSLVDGRFLI